MKGSVERRFNNPKTQGLQTQYIIDRQLGLSGSIKLMNLKTSCSKQLSSFNVNFILYGLHTECEASLLKMWSGR